MLKPDREIIQHKGTGGEFVEPLHYWQKQVLRLSLVLFSDSESLLLLTSQVGCSWRGTNSHSVERHFRRHKCSPSLFSSFLLVTLLFLPHV